MPNDLAEKQNLKKSEKRFFLEGESPHLLDIINHNSTYCEIQYWTKKAEDPSVHLVLDQWSRYVPTRNLHMNWFVSTAGISRSSDTFNDDDLLL